MGGNRTGRDGRGVDGRLMGEWERQAPQHAGADTALVEGAWRDITRADTTPVSLSTQCQGLLRDTIVSCGALLALTTQARHKTRPSASALVAGLGGQGPRSPWR
eukprot:3718252-Rhodomonas_salina.3